MKKMHYVLVLAIAVMFGGNSMDAQTMVTTQPRASQKAVVYQMLGLSKVKVIYHRPAVKGREVWGNLVPYNAPWRAGANENTVIYFSDDVKIEGEDLPAGTYGLHMIPSETTWDIAFSKNSSSWGSYSYNPADDALKVTVKPKKANGFHEYLTYTFNDIQPESMTCALQWADKEIPFKIEADVHSVVVASLKKELQTQAGWSWVGWNEAANYCLQNDTHLEEGMKWAQRSVFINPNMQNMMTKARLNAKVKGKPEKEDEIIMASLEKDLSAGAVTWKEYQGAAKWCAKQGKNDKALEWIGKSVSMSPNMTNMMTQSELLAGMGETKKAEKVKAEAMEKGTNAELNNYGYQLLQGGKKAEAVAVFEANVKKNPEDANAWDSLGEGYYNNGQKEKAIKAFKKSLSLNPPDNVKANSLKHLHLMDVNVKDMKKDKTTP